MMVVEHGTGGCTYQPYPQPMATYEDIVGSRQLFIDTLKNLHASMGTKFMIPIVGGKDLDLFRLFVEVTSRGGIAKIVNERKWKEVTAVFSFPSSATNASFILRKYYVSLLYHFEQMYFFKAKLWTTLPTDVLQNVATNTSPPLASPQHQANIATPIPEVPFVTPSAGSPVCGVIDGKFDGGYLITVKIGTEELKGVLYHEVVPNDNEQQPQRQSVNNNITAANHHSSSTVVKSGGVQRRKRRKKCEIRKRDPAHPKPNRSGYNFFFAEQHARLKPHYQGRDREISRIIGDTWNKLEEPQRSVYQEKALKDKERYRMEMEGYRERLRTGQIIGCAVPAEEQCPLFTEVESTDHVNSSGIDIQYCERMGSEKSDNLEEEELGEDKDSDFEEYPRVSDDHMGELKNVNIKVLADEAFDLQTRSVVDRVERGDGNENKTSLFGDQEKINVEEDGISVPIEERDVMLLSSNNNANDHSIPSS